MKNYTKTKNQFFNQQQSIKMKNSEQSAFPTAYDYRTSEFAGLAMQGMLVNGAMTASGNRSFDPRIVAKCALDQADLLLKEL